MVFRRTKMHIAFYTDSNGGSPQNTEIFNALNEAVDERSIKDASLFYNYVEFSPVSNRFGMFNSADMWSFTGNLIATTMENTIAAARIVNKFKLSYLYSEQDKERFGVLELFRLARSVPVIVTGEEDSDEVFRLTGVEPLKIKELSIDEIKKVLS
tara:strand:+ start:1348 stop:1812 length:465 start_codon:yes stop_codon:yes gene_type:complete